jgi:hypothetical protein
VTDSDTSPKHRPIVTNISPVATFEDRKIYCIYKCSGKYPHRTDIKNKLQQGGKNIGEILQIKLRNVV